MPNRKTHLGEAELEIMQILWSARQPQTAREILAQLQGKRPWALSTLMTALARLGEKGFVSCDRSTRTTIYTPKVIRPGLPGPGRESPSSSGSTGGPSPVLVASLYDSQAIGKEDLEELKAYLNALEGGEKDA